MSVTRKIYQKDEHGNFVEVADIGALAKFVLFEELNGNNQPATAVEIVARLRQELETAINNEASIREANDTSEANTRKAEDDKLQAAISKEITDRDNAVKAEKEARENADNTLQTNINNEQSARETADNNLQTNINNEKSARESADNAEQEARIAADNTLQEKINTEQETRGRAVTELQNSISTGDTNTLNSAKSYTETYATNAAKTAVTTSIADNNGDIIKAIKDTNSALRKALDTLYKTT